MGCYRDSSTRDLPNWLLTDFTSLSIESCITTCLNSDYPYAGVQAGYFFLMVVIIGSWKLIIKILKVMLVFVVIPMVRKEPLRIVIHHVAETQMRYAVADGLIQFILHNAVI